MGCVWSSCRCEDDEEVGINRETDILLYSAVLQNIKHDLRIPFLRTLTYETRYEVLSTLNQEPSYGSNSLPSSNDEPILSEPFNDNDAEEQNFSHDKTTPFISQDRAMDMTHEITERNLTYKKVIVTDVPKENGENGNFAFWAQHIDNVAAFEQMQSQLRAELAESPPLPGSVIPRKNDVVASKFIHDQWYRARIENVTSLDKVDVLYIDCGIREIVTAAKLAHLPPMYVSFPAQARQYNLACIRVPQDDDIVHDLTNAFLKEALNNKFSLNVEYKSNGEDYVSLTNLETKADVARTLLSYGVCLVYRRREKHLQNLINDYLKAEESAKKNRLNLWQYGDFIESP